MIQGQSIPALAMAAIAFYVGGYHLLLFMRRPSHTQDFFFSLTCFIIGLYDVSCAGLYSSASFREGASWQFVQAITLPLASVAFLWFVAAYAGAKSRTLPLFLTLVYSVLVCLMLLGPRRWTLTDVPMVREISLPFGFGVTYHEVELGWMMNLFGLIGIVIFAMVLYMGVGQWRTGRRGRGGRFIAAASLFFLTVFNDTAVASGLYSFIYLIEYGYLALILLMTYSLTQDVLKSATMKQALRDSEQRYRQFVEGSPGLFTRTNRQGEFLYVNRAAKEILGGTADACLGRSAFDFVHPHDRERTRAAFSRWLEEGRPTTGFENRQVSLAGEERQILWSVTPVLDEAGSVTHFDSIGQDLTDVRKAEADRERLDRDLVQTSELLQTVLDAIPDVIGLQDSSHRVLRYNRAGYEFLGKSREDIASHRCFELIGRSTPCEVCATTETYRTKKPARVEKYVPEMKAWLDVRSYPVLDENGEIVQVIEHLRDITREKELEQERQLLEKQVKHAQKLESLGVLAGGIAHDFNNLLMGILGNADLALDELPAGSQVERFINEIEKASRRASELCRQLLAYSGKGRFLIEMIDLSALVKDMTHLLEVSVSKKATLQCHFQSGLPAVRGDATQLRQVAMNLITNASESLGDHPGTITVRTGVEHCDRDMLSRSYIDLNLPEGDYVFFEVMDTGSGMDDATLSKIFDPFYSTKFTGRGLGLSAVLGIVRSHDGTLTIRSEPGQGTTFKVFFPAVHLDAPLAREKTAKRNKTPWRGQGTILLADDEDVIRNVTSLMLQKMGFQVLTASDGQEALDAFIDHPGEIALVLLDLTMPRMDGERCFREIRKISKDVPVLLSSGYSEQELSDKFTGAGPEGFIQKPYVYDVLLDAIKSSLPARRPDTPPAADASV